MGSSVSVTPTSSAPTAGDLRSARAGPARLRRPRRRHRRWRTPHLCAVRHRSGQVLGRQWHGQLGLGDTNHRGDAAGRAGRRVAGGRPRQESRRSLARRRRRPHLRSARRWQRQVLGRQRARPARRRRQRRTRRRPMRDGRRPPRRRSGRRAGDAVVAGSLHSCALLEDGTARCWGSNGGGQLGIGTTAHNPRPQVVDFVEGAGDRAGADHLTGRGPCDYLRAVRGRAIRCWGDGNAGQLGTDDKSRWPTRRRSATSLWARSVGGRRRRQLARLRAGRRGRVNCWGLNNFGQLGLGDAQNRGDDMNEMGDSLPFVDLGVDADGAARRAAASSPAAITPARCWRAAG